MNQKEQNVAMREFCRRVIQASWDVAMDDYDVQNWALELGLCYIGEATKEDCEGSFDGKPGDGIYRFEPWLERV
jgi:rRNA maturation endonuclease Nob1